MTTPSSSLPLPQFLSSTLLPLLPIFDDTLSVSSPLAQSLLSDALPQLYLIGRMLTSLGVFSDNEAIDEVGDREMVFMTLGWVVAEVEGRTGFGGLEDRKGALRRAEAAYSGFLALLQTYKVMDEEPEVTAPRDPAARRDAKIRAYRREKELKESIAAALPETPTSSTPLSYIIALLPSPSSESGPSTSTNSEPDTSAARSATLLLLQLLHTQSTASLYSVASELEIISNAPSDPNPSTAAAADDPRARRTGHEDSDWRLDVVPGAPAQPKQLISGGGKVLRPFTILPSTTALSDRERLRSEVFRSSHRLPTMTIDEYLEEEQRRGNIITGGGQASYDAPTESELLELEAENDGTLGAEQAAEKKRLKDENWARFTDDNRRGEGNTMNRG